MTTTRLSEDQTREELEASRAAIRGGTAPAGLLAALRSRFPRTYAEAFIVDWIPEQAEDIYVVLVHDEIATIEVMRRSQELVSCDVLSVAAYRAANPLPRSDRRRLELAMKLAAAAR